MIVPRSYQKSTSRSNSLSFAFTIPVQHKALPFNSDVSKKQLPPPLPTLKELPNVIETGKLNAFTKILNGRLHGKEMGVNTTQNNYNIKPLNLVGVPLNWGNKINKGISLSRFRTSTGNSSVRPRLGWKAKARPNGKSMNMVLSPVERVQTQSGLKVNTPLDEEIIVMGEPLIFTKGANKNVNYYASKAIALKGNVSSDIRDGNTSNVALHNNSSGAHLYKPAAPVELHPQGVRVQDAHQLANQSSDHVDFHHNTTVFTQGLKNNPTKTDDYLPEGVHKQRNEQTNKRPTQQSIASQAGDQEEEDGYETAGITEHGLHSNANGFPSNVEEESLNQETFGPQSRVSEQNQTELVYENDHEPIEALGFGKSTNLTNYQGNDTMNGRYDSQQNKAVNTDESDEVQNSTALQEESVGPEEKEMDNAQRISDNTSNLEQNQESKEDEQFATGNPITPLSNQRYVPVDEFGSPLYGTETGNVFLLNLSQ